MRTVSWAVQLHVSAPPGRLRSQISPIFSLIVAGIFLQAFHTDVEGTVSPTHFVGMEIAKFMHHCRGLEKHPENPHGSKPIVPAAVISDLVKWIGDHTKYDTSKTLMDPPSVNLCDQGTEIYYEGEMIIVDSILRAAYDMQNRQIYLVKPWEASDAGDLSTLLHELIHDVQYLDRKWSCKEEPEWEAYKLQEAWLAEQGVQSEFNWIQIFFLSRCPRDIHP